MDEHTGRGAPRRQRLRLSMRLQGEGDSERALAEEQREAAQAVARLERLLRVRSSTPEPTPEPTPASTRLAKLAHITDIDERTGETAVLLRGLVVCLVGLTYGGVLVSSFAAHV